MNQIKYYTLGSRSEKEGLTLMTALFTEDGKPLIGYDIEKMYKVSEITEEEYKSLKAEMINPEMGRLGIAGGLLDERGLAAVQALDNTLISGVNKMNFEKTSMLYAKFMKLEEMGISTVKDELELINLTANQYAQMQSVIGIQSLSDEDALAVWAVLNADEQGLSVETTLEQETKFGARMIGPSKTLGGINLKARKVEVMSWFNLADQFKSTMTNAEYVQKILELRGQLFFVAQPA